MVTVSSRGQQAERIGLLVSAVWQEVLGTAQAGEANFFAAGGDSLLATCLISRLNAQLGVKLSVRALFDAPTLAEFTARVQRDVERLRPRATERRYDALDESAKLSFSQERMWFMHALAAQSAAYNVPLALRLRGPLDVPRLRTALRRLVERHPMLTMTFPMAVAGPRSHWLPAESVELAELQLRVRRGTNPQEVIDRQLAEWTGEPFDLEHGPLLRLFILHVARDDAVLLLVMHHIITDQWSLDLLTRDLAHSYEALSGNGSRPQAQPPSYERYAAWHREWFTTRRLPTELAYWRHQLVGLEPVSLTGDYARPPQPSFRGASVRVPIAQRDVDRLTQLGAARGASLAMVMLAALNVLLSRHTGRTDIAVGVPIANRHHAGAENLVGVLVNTLVARTNLDGNPDFSTVLGRVRAVMLDAFEHQDMPFELLVRELQLSRDGSRSPLFSVMFNMLNTPPRSGDFGGLTCSRFTFDRRASQFDLTVTIDVVHDRSICFEYSTDVFARSTVERLARHYSRILHCAVADGAAPIATLPLLTEDEQELLATWGRGPSLPAVSETVVQFLERSFRRVPDRIALRCGERSFTYEALERAGEQVARALRARGFGPGTRVGLCLWRSHLSVIAQLGVLKAGAAYVPLDSSYPSERIAYIVRDSGLSAIVSTERLFPVLQRAEAKAELFDIEAILGAEQPQEGRARDGIATPRREVEPHEAAYVIYTSGSTGKPKGVEVSHRSVVNLLRSTAVKPGVGESDRLLSVTTLSFDISVLELLLPLTVGAEVIVASREQLADGTILGELIRTAQATVMQATPSTWRMLIDSGWGGSPTLKALVGGEPLSRQLAADLLPRCRELWNMYGPTETTVWSTCWRVEPEALDEISIGQPIANTSIHVLDANLQLVPIGAAGELFIGGDGVAVGYVNQPDLTAQRFLADPLGGRGSRLYRTGDRARWRHDGTLEHLGRLDSQVKIRGYRIELGEIESRLAEHPEVAGAVACVAQDDRGDACIVAYVVPRADMLEPGLYRAYLQRSLPSYMLPQYFVELDAVPLLANGKIDRVGLANASTEVRKARATLQPRDDREAVIHGVWSEVLANDEFGVHDSFFDLGGHSLLAVRVATRITAELGVACALPMLFRFPTIAALAAALGPAEHGRDQSLVALQPLGDGPPIFCISGVELYQPLADRLGAGCPIYGLFTPKEAAHWSAPEGTPPASVEELAADYLAVVRARQPSGPYILVGFSFGGVIAFEMAQQLAAAGAEVPLLVILDSDPPQLSGSARRRTFAALPIRAGARALLDLGSRLGGLAPFGTSGAAGNEVRSRRQRYVAAMHNYRAKPYGGWALLIESAEPRVYDPGHGWDALISQLDVQRVLATHVEILAAPHVDLWSEKVRAFLDAYAPSGAGT